MRDFAKEHKGLLPVNEVYLYGTFAKDEIHEGSDIDSLSIGDFKERFFELIGKILDLTGLPIEPIVYTNEEFDELKNSQNHLLQKYLKLPRGSIHNMEFRDLFMVLP